MKTPSDPTVARNLRRLMVETFPATFARLVRLLLKLGTIMSSILKRPVPAAGRRRTRGLRKLSPDSIGKATDETAAQVTRIGLTFLGTTAFCLLSLLSPDSALLGGSERINVPFAGPVSFFGFMLLGPAVLIVLRVYLQIYVEHSERLDRLARSMSVVRSPTLVPLQNPLIRCFSALIFYLLLPLTMMLFAWKAAVFPAWGSGLLCVAAGVVASHVMLLLKTFSWRSKVLITGAAIVGAGIMAGRRRLVLSPCVVPLSCFMQTCQVSGLFRTISGAPTWTSPT